MGYRILVINLLSLGDVDVDKLYHDLFGVNFLTLCDQYNLDPKKIEPAKSRLDVIVSEGGNAPYFLVNYGARYDRPIFVYEWAAKTELGRSVLENLMHRETSRKVTAHILQAGYIVEIEISPSQLKDMGLLFSYEIARWAASRGKGLVLGLDGAWYELNRYQAFIPADSKK